MAKETHCPHLAEHFCAACWREAQGELRKTQAAHMVAQDRVDELEFMSGESSEETRDIDAYADMLPREGWLYPLPPGVPQGWKAEVIHYPDEPRCEVRYTTPNGIVSFDLRSLPLVLLQAMAREAARPAGVTA